MSDYGLSVRSDKTFLSFIFLLVQKNESKKGRSCKAFRDLNFMFDIVLLGGPQKAPDRYGTVFTTQAFLRGLFAMLMQEVFQILC